MRKLLLSSLAIAMLVAPVVQAEVDGSEVDTDPLESTIDSILVSELEEGKLMWEVEGEPQQGFKVVWSKNESPEYPPRDGDKAIYRGENDARDAYIKGFEGEGTYNVRVCEYLDGVCGTYSNEIQMELVAKEDKMMDEKKKAKFKDLSDKNDNYDAIQYLYDKSVVQGYEDGTFKADNTINRAEFLKILMELSDYELSGENCFNDVESQWFASYVCTAANLGVVEGYDDGTFRPERAINFAEASKIIVNTLALETDSSNDETWFHSYVSAMELLAAIPTTIEDFDKKITRGEMSEMVYRIDAKKKNKKSKTYEGIKGKKDAKKEEMKNEEKMTESTISSIVVSEVEEGKVMWEVEGVSPQGFKVVWSKSDSPEYPPRETDKANYHGNKADRKSYLKAFDGAGTYNVRVCDYFEGECSVYSNQIQVELK